MSQKLRLMQLLTFAIVYPFVWVLSKLPMRILYVISDIVYFNIYYIFKYRKKTVVANLNLVFTDKTEAEKKQIAKGFYKHFSDLFMETIKSISISEKEILKRYQYKNPEVVKDLLKKGKSIAFVSAHQANWEWSVSSPLVLNAKVKGAYTSLGNSYFDKIVRKSREKFGFKCYPSAKTGKAILHDFKNKAQSIYLLISDQSPQLQHSLYWRDFLGIKVPVHVGAETLAKKFDLAVVYFATKKVKRGFYETEFKLITDEPKQFDNYEITDKYISISEDLILSQPECYLWSHKRFKHRNSYEKWLKIRKKK